MNEERSGDAALLALFAGVAIGCCVLLQWALRECYALEGEAIMAKREALLFRLALADVVGSRIDQAAMGGVSGDAPAATD